MKYFFILFACFFTPIFSSLDEICREIDLELKESILQSNKLDSFMEQTFIAGKVQGYFFCLEKMQKELLKENRCDICHSGNE